MMKKYRPIKTFIKKKVKLYIPNYSGACCFLSHPLGTKIRKEINLDARDKDDYQYTITFDDSTVAIGDSFIYGLFFKSVKKLGIVKFGLKYNIVFDNIPKLRTRESLENEYVNIYFKLSKMKKLKGDIY